MMRGGGGRCTVMMARVHLYSLVSSLRKNGELGTENEHRLRPRRVELLIDPSKKKRTKSLVAAPMCVHRVCFWFYVLG